MKVKQRIVKPTFILSTKLKSFFYIFKLSKQILDRPFDVNTKMPYLLKKKNKGNLPQAVNSVFSSLQFQSGAWQSYFASGICNLLSSSIPATNQSINSFSY